MPCECDKFYILYSSPLEIRIKDQNSTYLGNKNVINHKFVKMHWTLNTTQLHKEKKNSRRTMRVTP